jgi:hypothetical protein
MKFPPIYTLFCALILSGFVYAKYQGYMLFGTTNAATSGGGSRTSGGYIGGHK